MLNIKLSIPGFSDKLNISQFVGNNQNVGFGCKFYINDSDHGDIDYWFVIEDLQRQEECAWVNRQNIFFVSAEVAHARHYYDIYRMKLFLDQFGVIYTCHDIYRENSYSEIPFLPWMINANHGASIFSHSERDVDWLKFNNNMSKSKTISVFCSTQQLTPDHRLRLKFVKEIKNYFGDLLDWYGNGINPLKQKWDGIAPYKYHIVLENQSRNNIITEKLFDSFLGLAFPIYYGAPNVNKYFNSKSLAQIDIVDLKGSIKIIEELLDGNVSELMSGEIIESRNKVLFEFNLFNRIAMKAWEQENRGIDRPKVNVCLHSANSIVRRTLSARAAGRTGIFLKHISEVLVAHGG